VNLRILKKLSKKAAPLLIELGYDRESIVAEEEGCVDVVINDQNDWRRLVYWAPLSEPMDTLRNTMTVWHVDYWGEGDQVTAWCELSTLVFYHYADWESAKHSPDGMPSPELTIKLRNPADVLNAARRMVEGSQP